MNFGQYRLGIDFGTTYSRVATWKDDSIILIPNSIGEPSTPSEVIFESPSKCYVGEETLNHLSHKNSVTIYEIKRLLGKSYDEIKDIINYFPFKIIKDEDKNKPVIKMTFNDNNSIELYPEQIVTLILKKLIMNDEYFLSQKIKEIIISVPANFSELQKKAMKYAAEEIDGIRIIKIINEYSASILAYAFPKNKLKNNFFPFNKYIKMKHTKTCHPMEENIISSNLDQIQSTSEQIHNENNNYIFINSFFTQKKDLRRILVIDLGGGSFDVSLIEVENDENNQIYELKASIGNQELGGSDFDKKLMDYCIKEFLSKNYTYFDPNILQNNYKCIRRLKRVCEESKKFLSINSEDTLLLEDFYDEKPLVCKITRAKFEELCKDLFAKLIIPIDNVLKEVNLKNENIDEIICAGGCCLIPKVKEIIQLKFPTVPINDKISPDEAVAFGAAIYAESLRKIDEEF